MGIIFILLSDVLVYVHILYVSHSLCNTQLAGFQASGCFQKTEWMRTALSIVVFSAKRALLSEISFAYPLVHITSPNF